MAVGRSSLRALIGLFFFENAIDFGNGNLVVGSGSVVFEFGSDPTRCNPVVDRGSVNAKCSRGIAGGKGLRRLVRGHVWFPHLRIHPVCVAVKLQNVGWIVAFAILYGLIAAAQPGAPIVLVSVVSIVLWSVFLTE